MRRFFSGSMLLALAACTTAEPTPAPVPDAGSLGPVSEAEIAGCRAYCRSRLECSLSRPEALAGCVEVCTAELGPTSVACRAAATSLGACAANTCAELGSGACQRDLAALPVACAPGFELEIGFNLTSGCVSINRTPYCGATDAGAGDVGRPDAGFADRDILLAGLQDLHGLDTYMVMMGTLSSTMPPALLLHSGPAIAHEYLLPHLKSILPGRLLVLYDMRATGRSSFGRLTGGSTLTLAQHAADLTDVADFVEALSSARKFDLVGHGYGAAVAATWAVANPARVSRLVFVTPYPVDVNAMAARNGETNRRLTTPDRQRLEMIRNRPECLQDFSQCYLQLWDIYGPKSMCPDKRERWEELNFEYGEIRAQYFVENQLQDAQFDLRPLLARLAAPTTIIGGRCDVTDIGSTDAWAAAVPNAQYHRLTDTGHFPMVETSTTFTRILRSALIYP